MAKDQVKLPLSVAYEITLQGIQIRLGRSVVTVLGVVLGIAFLMSILAGMAIKKGVASEEDTRINVRRMQNILTAETGSLKAKTIGVVYSGSVDESDFRLVRFLQQEKSDIKIFSVDGDSALIKMFKNRAQLSMPSQKQVIAGSVLVMLMGDRSISSEVLQNIASEKPPIVASTTKEALRIQGHPVLSLARQMSAEDIARAAAEATKIKFRGIWVLIISLLVTVIGISNAMLMSVTERFKEIGTMKCLGALSSFVRQLFVIESIIVGFIGSLGGCIVGIVFSLVAYSFSYGFALVFSSLPYGILSLYLAGCMVAGIILSVVAAIYPAHFASKMIPAAALRSTI